MLLALAVAGPAVAMQRSGASTAAATPVSVNFQPAGAPVPSGYVVDSGAAYTDARGYGWVTQASLGSATHDPLDLTPNTRDRNLEADQRLDTVMHMQYPPSSTSTTAVKTPGAWEYAVANGLYQVTVAVGDPFFGSDPENYVIHVEGATAVAGYAPTGGTGSATRHTTATVTVPVSDGRLTVDAIGGTNTKLDYVDIAPTAPDTTPPAAPQNVAATAGDSQIALSWSANGESDFAGYNIYRSTSLPVGLSSPLNGASPLASIGYLDTGLQNGTTYYYVVEAVDSSGNKAQAAAVSATPQTSTVPLDVKVNFADQGTAPPAGYVTDWGQQYGLRSGANQGSGLSYGWVVPGTSTPLNLVGNGRNRNNPPYSLNDPDVRLATFIHMQGNDVAGFTGIASPGAWELAVPNGTYNVTVSVGDDATRDSSHQIQIEGQTVIAAFVPTSNLHASASKLVSVADGRLTIDANGGRNTKINYVTVQGAASGATNPSVRSSSPANGATNVLRNTPVTAEVSLPNVGAGVDEATLTSANVRLLRESDGSVVPANVNTSGGGDVIVLQPTVLLDANTTYRFEVTAALKDLSGASFTPFTSRFTTGSAGGGSSTSGVAFEKVALPTATGRAFTSLAIGPDNKLYAGTLDGDIVRFPINADGTTGTAEVISTIRTAEGGPRTIVGLAFDPAATAANPILWVTNDFSWTGSSDAPDWSGKITRLSGAALGNAQNYVVGLPRSIRDHETNSLAFGPDGALYVAQGSLSSTGEADPAWGNRAEHPLSAAILRIDTSAITSPPLDVKTPDGGGSYNPSAGGAPLTVYASGLRNAYDMVWHSNGKLYAPTNGAATGGNAPATPATLPASCANRIDSASQGAYTGPQVPGLTNQPVAQDDFLFRVVKGGYYGHPNPQRCEWVLNGGNPTSGADPAEVTQYPVGTQPDRNWRGAAYDFGLHYSPDGTIEYTGPAFGGALNGKILVARYSAGDDIIALTPNGTNGDISGADAGIPGLSGFNDPLDLTETPANGNLYVTELGAGRITLLRPSANAKISVGSARLIFNDVQGGAPSATQNVNISNTGGAPLSVTGLSFSGPNAGQFQLASPPALPLTIPSGGSVNVGVAFNPSSVGPMGASLDIASSDAATPTVSVVLRGLGALGVGGTSEPSLQWILDTYQIPIQVGDSNPGDSLLPPSPLLGDEVSMDRLQRATAGPVTVEPIGVFGPQSSGGTVAAAGWYVSGNPASKTQLFTVPNSAYQALQPTTSGTLSFDPGAATFGFYSVWPFFSNREVDQEDAFNTWEPTVPNRHKVRVYPLKASNGTVTPNAYVVAFEETTSDYDYQDLVFIVRNVKSGGAALPPGSVAVNFQPAGAPVPTGYTVDSGAAWTDARGSGWVTQASLSGASHTPLDLTPNTRDRNLEVDQRLDTLIHMQYPPAGSSATAVKTPGAWEYALANGSYQVTVGLGDPLVGSDAENYVLRVEGVTAVDHFIPTGANGSSTRHVTATVTVNVSDGRLTIDAIGGTNTKLDYVLISPSTADTTAPSVSVQLSGTLQSPNTYVGKATVTITSADTGGSGLASTTYSLDGASFQPYTAAFDVTGVGNHTIAGRATDNAGNVTTTSLQSFSVVSGGGTGNPQLVVENLDGAPFSDRFVFNRIGSLASPPPNGVHDVATVRLRNTGSDPLHITGLPISGPWQLVSPPTLPATVAAGGQLDVPIKFVATSGRVTTGTLTVQSDDPSTPSKVLTLAGYWQSLSENGQEPTLSELIRSVFGYQTTLVNAGQQLNQQGLVTAVGEEVLSPYWERVDTTKPVSVTQLDAFHTQGNTATLQWFKQGATSTAAFLTHAGIDGQSVLPHLAGSTTALAKATFTPGATSPVFGFRVDTEWSDPTLNDQTADHANGCTNPCGHHVRFWPVRDRAGVLIPDTYFLTMDYSGINYDYNDNVYLISNIKPAALYRLDVGGSANFTDSKSQVWTPDTGLFSPSTAIAEAGSLPNDVTGTTDDTIYLTYRGNVGAVPLDQRVLSYALPIKAGLHKVNLRLHFAERCSCDTTVGSRVFNITAEGQAIASNFDIVQAAGAANKAFVLTVNDVAVSDGTLNLVFSAVVDYPAINGIEVYGVP